MDFGTTVLLVTNIINLLFVALIFLRSRPGAAEKFLGFALIAAALWNFSQFLIQVSKGTLPLVVLYPYLASTPIASSFFIFAVLFPNEKAGNHKKLIFLSYFLNLLIIAFILIPGGVIDSYSFDENGRWSDVTFGPFFILFAIYIFSFFSLAFFYLIKNIQNSKGTIRAQLIYIFLGALISASAGVFINLFLPILGIMSFLWFGPSAVIFLFLFSVYAIFRHHLFDIRVQSTEMFAGLITFIFFIQALLAKSKQELIFSLALFLLVFLFSVFLVRGTLREVRKLRELSEAKSEFISIVSHQLRSPLTAIKGYVSMLAEGSFGKIDEKIREILNKVYLSNERLIKLVEDILSLSKIEKGKMEFNFQKVNICDIIQSVVEEFSSLAKEKGLTVSFEESGIFQVAADPIKIRQVIANLVDNAIRYTDTGYINITANPKSSPPATFLKKSGGGQVRNSKQKGIIIKIKDTGMGITKEEMAGLFERFHRGVEIPKIHPEGIGLGLYIAKKIIEAHGGKIWAESEGRSKGSAFFVELPLG